MNLCMHKYDLDMFHSRRIGVVVVLRLVSCGVIMMTGM